MVSRSDVISGTKHCAGWWINQRAKKILSASHDTMTVNPFLIPLAAALHNFEENDEVSDFFLTGHFIGGHNTGFGKLIDEKILPSVFGATKLDRKNRVNLKLTAEAFNNIDHVIDRADGRYMISLKASKWTIQLAAAKNLNTSFSIIKSLADDKLTDVAGIVVGVSTGKTAELTDKYDILRGINRGAKHDVKDVTDFVRVLAGRDFWSWLGGHDDTQDWIMAGILEAIKDNQALLKEVAAASSKMEESFAKKFPATLDLDDIEAWESFLKNING